MIKLLSSAVVESYEAVGKHTYPSVTITAAYLLAMLILLCAFYRSLAPRHSLELGGRGNYDAEENLDLEGKFRSLDATKDEPELNGFATGDIGMDLRTQRIEGMRTSQYYYYYTHFINCTSYE